MNWTCWVEKSGGEDGGGGAFVPKMMMIMMITKVESCGVGCIRMAFLSKGWWKSNNYFYGRNVLYGMDIGGYVEQRGHKRYMLVCFSYGYIRLTLSQTNATVESTFIILLPQRPSLPPPRTPQIWRSFNPQLQSQIIHIPLQLLLPININNLPTFDSIPERPRPIHPPKPFPLPLLQPRDCKDTQPRHRKQRVRKLKRFKRNFALHHNRQTSKGVVEIMTFAISLHHIGAFRVRNVFDWVARVGGYPFTVEPGSVRGANAISREEAEVG